MFGIVVGTHGPLAEGLVQSCEAMYGKQANVRAVTLGQEEGQDDVVDKYRANIKEIFSHRSPCLCQGTMIK